MHLFTADRFEGSLTDCDEGELCWVEKERILDLPIWSGDKIFLELINNPLQPFFSLKLVYRGEQLVSALLDGNELQLS